ncbi:hypothetical protein HHI36_021439 [Cryptolaemus montrouzieri]|uniref:Fatty acyl-CoA reductase n=1 Tax=Cryptolaemus montrouzieri TaxID=559131 RepID=A0ABD2MY57_9CUCU
MLMAAQSQIFERLHAECPKFIHRVVGINGDVSYPDLGISKTDKQTLIENINVVFHGAATVRFDENLKLAYNVNVTGAERVLELGKQMKHLKSFMHVSTAYSNCFLNEIEEKIYDYPVNHVEIGEVLEKLTENQADALTTRIIGAWPNTYTFTKALAERMISQSRDNLPVGIFRPSIVISTYQEPQKGWINNMYGPTGMCAGALAGIVRVVNCTGSYRADMVPVDMCVAALIAGAWDVSEKTKNQRPEDDPPIYNYVSGEHSFTWKEYCTVQKMYGDEYPSNRALWMPYIPLISNMYFYTISILVFHLIPAFIMDVISMLFMKKPRLLSVYKKVHKLSDVLGFFCNRQWSFTDDNVVKLWNKLSEEEKKLFSFDIASLDWWKYYKNYMIGLRKYIMKESIDTLESARKRLLIFQYISFIFTTVAKFTMSVLLWNLVQRLFFSSVTSCVEVTEMNKI